MSIDRLRYFAAVVETRSLRKAAELVGISAPSMSKAISVLEDELSHKLIHPNGRGIGITPKGIEVYNLSSGLLDEYRNFHEKLKKGSSKGNKIRLASFEVFTTYFLSSFLLGNPEFDFLILEKIPGKIEQAILTGMVDFGITYLPAPDPLLEYREIGSFKMGIFGNEKWNSFPFEKWPFAVPTTELRLNSLNVDALDLWPAKAPQRKIRYQFELLETALQTTRKGLSVIHCPDFIALLQNEEVRASFKLCSLPFPIDYKKIKPIKIYLIGRKGEISSEIEGKFAKFVRTLRIQ